MISKNEGVSTFKFSSPFICGIETIACSNGGEVFIAGTDCCTLRKLVFDFTNWKDEVIAGETYSCNSILDGTFDEARFSVIWDINFDEAGSLIIGDGRYLRILTNQPPQVLTVVGPQGFGSVWEVDELKGDYYIADWDNHIIHKISNNNTTTVVGTGSAGYSQGPAESAQITRPIGIACDNLGNIYFTETGKHSIRKYDINSDSVYVFAGKESIAGNKVGNPIEARFQSPTALTFNRDLNILYIVDSGNFSIKQIKFE